MSNVYTMVPKKPAQYNILTKQERLVYVPLATTETAGIVKIGEGLSVNEGLLSVGENILEHIDWSVDRIENLQTRVDWASSMIEQLDVSYMDLSSKMDNKVDVSYDLIRNNQYISQFISNNNEGLFLFTEYGISGINGYMLKANTELNLEAGFFRQIREFRQSSSSGTNVNSAELVFDHDNNVPKLEYIKTDYAYNGELATLPYVENSATLLRGYVDNRITELKKSAGYVFDTFVNFEQWIIGNYIREDGVAVTDLNVGDDIFIKEEGIPDYWVASVEQPFTLDNFSAYESGDYKPTILWLGE